MLGQDVVCCFSACKNRFCSGGPDALARSQFSPFAEAAPWTSPWRERLEFGECPYSD